jgi:hypothetical protein
LHKEAMVRTNREGRRNLAGRRIVRGLINRRKDLCAVAAAISRASARRDGEEQHPCLKRWQAISGHKTRSVLDRYNILSETALEAAAKDLTIYYEQEKATIPATLAAWDRIRISSPQP